MYSYRPSQASGAYSRASYAVMQGARGPLEAWLGYGARVDSNMFDLAVTTAKANAKDQDHRDVLRLVAQRYLAHSPDDAGRNIRTQMAALEASGEKALASLANILKAIVTASTRAAAAANAGNQPAFANANFGG